MKLHASITSERLLDAARRSAFGTDNPGFCAHCGEEADGCEPDAEHYTCEYCGHHAVFGAEQLLLPT